MKSDDELAVVFMKQLECLLKLPCVTFVTSCLRRCSRSFGLLTGCFTLGMRCLLKVFVNKERYIHLIKAFYYVIACFVEVFDTKMVTFLTRPDRSMILFGKLYNLKSGSFTLLVSR